VVFEKKFLWTSSVHSLELEEFLIMKQKYKLFALKLRELSVLFKDKDISSTFRFILWVLSDLLVMGWKCFSFFPFKLCELL